MIIDSIHLQDFRNFKDEKAVFSPALNIIIGENAQGKTNLMEAIYLTSFGKSFRTRNDQEMIRFGADFCRVSAAFSEMDADKIQVVIGRDGKKAAMIDRRKIEKTSQLLGQVICIAFTPEDLKIVKEDPARRREFIDRELSRISRAYLEDLKTYRKALQQRNAALKEQTFRGNQDEALDIWDEILAASGAEIIERRRRFLEEISQVSSRIHRGITNGREELQVSYSCSIPLSLQKKKIRETLYETLREERSKDRERGFTGKGPHRDDLILSINEVNARKFGSQGQQRTAALSLKLAEIDIVRKTTGQNPILLLDDVLSELDVERQQYMIETLKDVQMMITTTEVGSQVEKELADAERIRICRGKVEA